MQQIFCYRRRLGACRSFPLYRRGCHRSKGFHSFAPGLYEIGGYILAIVCAWGFSYALAMQAHIRLTALISRFSVGIQALANIVTYGALTLLAFLMAWRGTAMLIETLEIHAVAPTPLETPLWIPQGLWSLGLLWFFLHVSIYFIHAIFLFTKGKTKDINKLYGIDTN